MRSRRRTWLVVLTAGVAVLAMFLVLLLRPSGPGMPPPPREAGHSTPQPEAAFPAGELEPQPTLRSASLVFHDLILDTPLRLPEVRIVTGGELVAEVTGGALPLGVLAGAPVTAAWEYEVPGLRGPRPWRQPLRAALPDAGGVVRLPFSASCRGYVVDARSGMPVRSATILAYVVDPEDVARLRREHFGGPGQLPPGALDSLPFLLRALQDEGAPLLHRQAQTDEHGRYTLALEVTGTTYLHAWVPGLAPMTRRVSTRPGQVTELDLFLEPRPIVHGLVLDPEGRPVPAVPVTVYVVDEGRAVGSLSPMDLEAGLGIGRVWPEPGVPATMVGTRTVQTDAAGGFRVVMPVGSAYAAGAWHGNMYGFRATETSAAGGQREEIELDVRLQSGRDVPAVRICTADGRPLAGATVRLAIHDDYPWFRQFPESESDAAGMVALPWREDGRRYTVFVSHPWLRRMFLAEIGRDDDKVVVPSLALRRGS